MPDLELIVQYLRGPVSGNDAIDLVKTIRKDDAYNPNFNVLIDFRDITLDWEIKQVKDSLAEFIHFINENPDLMSNKKLSILFSKPNQAVLSILLRENYSAFPISTGLYSTLEVALDNLNISKKNVQSVNEEIEKFKIR